MRPNVSDWVTPARRRSRAADERHAWSRPGLFDVGEFFGLLLANLVGGEIGWWWSEKARQRRTARAFAAGRNAVFTGWVLGVQPYCRAAGGLLVLEVSGAFYHVVDRGMPITRRDIPVERLVVVRRRTGTWDDHTQRPANWDVFECLDDQEPVLIACHQGEASYVEQALQRRAETTPRRGAQAWTWARAGAPCPRGAPCMRALIGYLFALSLQRPPVPGQPLQRTSIRRFRITPRARAARRAPHRPWSPARRPERTPAARGTRATADWAARG